MKLSCCDKQRLYKQLHRQISPLDNPVGKCRINTSGGLRSASTAATGAAERQPSPQAQAEHAIKSPLGRLAKQKEADRVFFADLLSSAATKRDAKAYLSRLKAPPKTKSLPARTEIAGSYVNLGNLFPGIRAAEQSPVFSQEPYAEADFQEEEVLHVALVKVCDVETLPENLLLGIGETLSQLNRLSLSPCVIVQSTRANSRPQLNEDADRLVDAINAYGESVARRVDNVFVTGTSTHPKVAQRKLLLRPLKKGHIPVLTSVAYDANTQRMTVLPSSEAMLAVTRELAGLNIDDLGKDQRLNSTAVEHIQKQVSLSKIITIDSAGGIPSSKSSDGCHVFLNLEQEYQELKDELQSQSSEQTNSLHLSNLDLVQECLQLLPPSSSGLMTTYVEAANSSRVIEESAISNVGTRRQKNALIHNLLTDKPAYSSSLPSGRLQHKPNENTSALSHSTFIKRGMPLTILPDPSIEPWTPTSPRLKLTDPRIDLGRLVHLIEDSFNRKLDVEDYLRRVNDRIAGVIIAGEYEGGALLTWEHPPDAPSADPQLVPYLDKFAVLKRAQGAGGVADIVFNAMVRTCFPSGVCWRSRKDNPVNKWYFERSRGTWKIPDMNWTMFWTTPGIELHGSLFREYEAVCRGVAPSWADKKKVAD